MNPSLMKSAPLRLSSMKTGFYEHCLLISDLPVNYYPVHLVAICFFSTLQSFESKALWYSPLDVAVP